MKEGIVKKDKSIEALKWEITSCSGARLAASWEHRQAVSIPETHHISATPLNKSWHPGGAANSPKKTKRVASSIQFFRENAAIQANQ
jgi:hypothetical protein